MKQTPDNLQTNAKLTQLETYAAEGKNQLMTTNLGLRVTNDDDSLKAGLRGPTLLEDFHLREKITHFDHERIPERVVHARGSGAHGVFELYDCMSPFTMAKFLNTSGKKTPVFVRFSTVAGERGSADTVRDVRGFATKFYTEEGNYDIVGNNIPVFFIQDAMKFPDIIHAVKAEPHNAMPQATSAHDTFWDFITSAPETAHMVMWAMSDRAIPRSYRMMEGFGVNTFRFINSRGQARFVKFHWKPKLGVHSLMRDEAQLLSGKDPDFHRRDLWDAIEQGNYPEYELGVQMIEEEQEFAFDFDILDPTKFWPEELIPVHIVGKMTLNKNVDNFFSETEQVAFCPANLVPGIDFSNDPLLQGRLFSYQDTQLSRLGGPNFHEIPINRPVVNVRNNQRDGLHRMQINKGPVSYFPNALDHDDPKPATEAQGGFSHYAQRVDGRVIRGRSDSFKDHFGQAALFFNSLSPVEQAHVIDAFHFEVGGVKDMKIRQRVVDMFNNVDGTLARRIAEGVGASPPASVGGGGSKGGKSPAVSQMTTPTSPATRKVAVLLAEGYCGPSTRALLDALKASGVSGEIIACHQGQVAGGDGQMLEAPKSFTNAHSVLYDAVFVAAGPQSVQTLSTMPEARDFINTAWQHAKPIGALGEGVDLLMATDAAEEGQFTSAKSARCQSALGVVTQRATDDVAPFCREFIDLVGQHRHWARLYAPNLPAPDAPLPAGRR